MYLYLVKEWKFRESKKCTCWWENYPCFWEFLSMWFFHVQSCNGFRIKIESMKSRTFFIPSCHMQQLHATKARLSTFEPPQKNPKFWKPWRILKLLGNSPCHIPNQQPTTNNRNVSEASAAKQRKVTSNVRPVWPSKCGVWRPTSSGSSVGPTARGVVSPGSLWLFCLELTGTSLLGCKPKFWLTLISSGYSENSGPAFLLEFPWRPHANFLEKLKHRLAFPILFTFSEMDRWAIWLP